MRKRQFQKANLRDSRSVWAQKDDTKRYADLALAAFSLLLLLSSLKTLLNILLTTSKMKKSGWKFVALADLVLFVLLLCSSAHARSFRHQSPHVPLARSNIDMASMGSFMPSALNRSEGAKKSSVTVAAMNKLRGGGIVTNVLSSPIMCVLASKYQIMK